MSEYDDFEQLVLPSELLEDLAREKVVLFLGAGVSASAITAAGSRIAGWPAFLKKMAGLVDGPVQTQVFDLIDNKDYLLACELLQISLSDQWDRQLKTEFLQRATPSELHKSIVSLNQRIIITTNFDKLLERAWEDFDNSSTHLPEVYQGIDDRVFGIMKDHFGRHIIKIHGSIDDSSKIIFSRSEYIRLAFGNEKYANFLENLLLNFTFLFIGFSMDDPAVLSIMELYAFRYRHARPHYILSDKLIAPNIASIFKRMRKLQYLYYNSADSHARLPIYINRLAQEARSRKGLILQENLK